MDTMILCFFFGTFVLYLYTIYALRDSISETKTKFLVIRNTNCQMIVNNLGWSSTNLANQNTTDADDLYHNQYHDDPHPDDR